MTRLRGRALRGQRVVEAVPHGHWKTTTLIAALDGRGIRCSLVLDGAVDGAAFEAFVEAVLVPTLRPGDLVILDNLSSHKGPRVGRSIRAAQADVLYLPPYSPDFNPIENMWSKVKASMRKAAARTFETVVDAVGEALLAVSTTDCQGYFSHCGYEATST